MREFENEHLQDLISEADIPILLMVLVHLTGDTNWLNERYHPERTGRVFADESGGLPEEVQAEVRDAAAAALIAARTPALSKPDEATLRSMMSVCVGEDVPSEYVPVLREEMGFDTPPLPDIDNASWRPFVVIIGAGVSGLCAAVRFARMGVPYLIVEKGDSIGGTWYENTYPEAGVDTPNHFYSYTFASDYEWRHYFSKQREILDYLKDVAKTYQVTEHVRFCTRATQARWNDEASRWETAVINADGTEETLRSDMLITAVGQLNQPKLPDIAGLDDFDGFLFHTARWPEGLDVSGKRIAMIGTGASAVQAARTIAADAAQLTIFQRSPQWVDKNHQQDGDIGF